MSNAELFRAVQQWAAENYPGLVHRMRLMVELHGGNRTSLAVPSPAVKAPGEKKYNDVQLAIIESLEGKALKTTALVKATGYSSSQIFRSTNGMQELKDDGVVDHDSSGFFRPDAPPAQNGN